LITREQILNCSSSSAGVAEAGGDAAEGGGQSDKGAAEEVYLRKRIIESLNFVHETNSEDSMSRFNLHL
jgi:hypothetical protein